MRIKFTIQVYSATLFIFLLLSVAAFGQSISSFLPARITKSEKYLFYLHGGVVTILGNNAINQSMPEWGPYEYLNILDLYKAVDLPSLTISLYTSRIWRL